MHQNPLNFINQRFRMTCLCDILLAIIPLRNEIKIGMNVQIIQKQDQLTGNLTDGAIKRILTTSNSYPHGIKVELDGGKIGRVQNIV